MNDGQAGTSWTMSGHRPRLFLSSTTDDLDTFRAQVIEVCSRLSIDVEAMENWGPDPSAAASLCQCKIANADIFLGIYAYRYGSQPEGFDGKSYTELEYEWAVARRPRPQILIYMIKKGVLWIQN